MTNRDNQRRFKLYLILLIALQTKDAAKMKTKVPISLAMDGCNNSEFNNFFRENRISRKQFYVRNYILIGKLKKCMNGMNLIKNIRQEIK